MLSFPLTGRPVEFLLPRQNLIHRCAKWCQRPHVLTGIAAVAVTLLASIVASLMVAQWERTLAVQEFEARANSHALTLQKGIDQQLGDIFAVRALFQTSQRPINRTEFTDFSKLLLRDHPAITGVSWIPRVKREEREAHELAAREEGLTGYHINSAAGDGMRDKPAERAEYFPRLYSSSELPGAAAYGLDLNDGGLRQRTLERARDGDLLATSPTFQLRVSEGDRNGFFALLPVYAPNSPHENIEDRQRNLVGFVQGVFRTGIMIETVLSATSPGGVDLYFMNGDAERVGTLLYFHPSRERTDKAQPLPPTALLRGLHWTSELRIGDSKWLFVAVPIPGGPGVANYSGAWMTLIAGLLFSAFIGAHFFNAGRHARSLQKANDALDIANERLQAQNTRFDTALNNMSQGLVMFDSAERLVICNDLYFEMYGLSREIVKPGCAFHEVLRHRIEIGSQLRNDAEQYRHELLAALAQGKVTNSLLETKDGRDISVTNSPMPGGGWVATHEDITERRRAEAKISYMAHHDALTALPNRLLFRERLQQALARAKRGEQLAILCLDLDHFKSVNDTLGHPVGDLLLKSVAERLSACVRESDVVARLGGDEFAIVQSGTHQPTDATALATRLIDEISGSYTLDSHQVAIGISVGIAMTPTDGLDPDQLLKNADLALYRAKSDGRGVYRFFEPEMDALMQARRTLELDLRNAIANAEFQLFYQPLVCIATGHITGFEALIRWRHPRRGMVSPAEFIPLAEETGLIAPLGEWVLNEACKEASAWPDDIRVAVNLSPLQFRSKNLLLVVQSALTSSGLPPNRLELEITESVLLNEGEATLDTLHQFRELGIRISMDDFGTGYSSLSYLRKFPFDKIKIDQSFIRDVAVQEESLAIVRAVAAMGSSLGVITTAEGVETFDQLNMLRKEGCVEVQGYIFSPPRPACEVASLLDTMAPKLKAIA